MFADPLPRTAAGLRRPGLSLQRGTATTTAGRCGRKRVPYPAFVRSAVAAFRYRNFRLFWCGSVVSSTGTWMQNVTVPYVLFQLTHSGVWVGLAVVAQILPSLVLSPTAGSLADRFSRRRVLLITQCAQLIGAGAMWGVWVGGLHSPVLMLLIVAAGGTA